MLSREKKTTTEQIIERAVKGVCALRFLMNRVGTDQITMDMTGRRERITIRIEDLESPEGEEEI